LVLSELVLSELVLLMQLVVSVLSKSPGHKVTAPLLPLKSLALLMDSALPI